MEIAKLKNMAKIQMKRNTGLLIVSNLMFGVLTMIIPIIQLISNTELNSITKFILMTLVQPLFLGIAYIHYNFTIEGSEVKLLDLLYGYKVNLLRQGVVYIVRTIITYLMTSSLVTLATTVIMIFRPNQVMVPIIMAIIIFVPSFILQTYLSQIYYIMVCNKDLKGTQVLRDSMLMMKGRLVEYIGITLSFLPWLILDIFTFKLASIWVNPYKNQTLANYYNTVKNEYYNKRNKNIVA
ncbi:MAG: DUF975 family protein [Paraclostridium sp.]|uniref:DUF975 family protein n=1 Tax=Paraclostridium sp. TaxID=2023273 RepID=UPI003F33588B